MTPSHVQIAEWRKEFANLVGIDTVLTDVNNFAAIGLDKEFSGYLRAQIEQILEPINQAATAMREGRGIAPDWGIIAGHLSLAISIELGGIVRRFSEEWFEFQNTMQDIHDRAIKQAQPESAVVALEKINQRIDLNLENFHKLEEFSPELQELAEKAISTLTTHPAPFTLITASDVTDEMVEKFQKENMTSCTDRHTITDAVNAFLGAKK
jgi:hypothetical protein